MYQTHFKWSSFTKSFNEDLPFTLPSGNGSLSSEHRRRQLEPTPGRSLDGAISRASAASGALNSAPPRARKLSQRVELQRHIYRFRVNGMQGEEARGQGASGRRQIQTAPAHCAEQPSDARVEQHVERVIAPRIESRERVVQPERKTNKTALISVFDYVKLIFSLFRRPTPEVETGTS